MSKDLPALEFVDAQGFISKISTFIRFYSCLKSKVIAWLSISYSDYQLGKRDSQIVRNWKDLTLRYLKLKPTITGGGMFFVYFGAIFTGMSLISARISV